MPVHFSFYHRFATRPPACPFSFFPLPVFSAPASASPVADAAEAAPALSEQAEAFAVAPAADSAPGGYWVEPQADDYSAAVAAVLADLPRADSAAEAVALAGCFAAAPVAEPDDSVAEPCSSAARCSYSREPADSGDSSAGSPELEPVVPVGLHSAGCPADSSDVPWSASPLSREAPA
jgi:hypothetical protein